MKPTEAQGADGRLEPLVGRGWIATPESFLRHCASVMGGVIDGCVPGPEDDRQYYGGAALEELGRCRLHLLEVLDTPAPAEVDPLASLATVIHYPDHWDAAAYPTPESAIREALFSVGCSECSPIARFREQQNIQNELMRAAISDALEAGEDGDWQSARQGLTKALPPNA